MSGCLAFIIYGFLLSILQGQIADNLPKPEYLGELCQPHTFTYPEGCVQALFPSNGYSDDLCIYRASFSWLSENSIRFEVSTRYAKSLYGKLPWIGIGFSNGPNMSDGVDAVIGTRVGQAIQVEGVHLSWYDFIDPDANINYFHEGLIDTAGFGDSVAQMTFRKRTSNILPHEIDFRRSSRTGIWFFFPVYGGRMDGKYVKRHIITPVRKFYQFLPCENKRQSHVNGRWGSWNAWSSCSTSCGDDGVRSRSRSCDSPKPSPMGQNCMGPRREVEGCLYQTPCLPVHFACHEIGEKPYFAWPEKCYEKSREGFHCQYLATWDWMDGSKYVDVKIVTRYQPHRWAGVAFHQSKHASLDMILAYYNWTNGQSRIWTPIYRDKHSTIPVYGSLERKLVGEVYLSRLPDVFPDQKEAIKKDNIGNLAHRLDRIERGIDENGVEEGNYLMVTSFQKPVHPSESQYDTNLAKDDGAWWAFLVRGGRVEYDQGDMGFERGADSGMMENVILKHCTPTERSFRSSIECFNCADYSCFFRQPGTRERCPSGVNTCQQFRGRKSKTQVIDGRRHVLRMCGAPDEVIDGGPEPEVLREGCRHATFYQEGQEFEGTLCVCDVSLCNGQQRPWLSSMAWMGVWVARWIRI